MRELSAYLKQNKKSEGARAIVSNFAYVSSDRFIDWTLDGQPTLMSAVILPAQAQRIDTDY
jgi:hypothetical protein